MVASNTANEANTAERSPHAVFMTSFWAKTLPNGKPGISVRDHCVNVGAVGEALARSLPEIVKDLIPAGSATLAALHDVGKISPGFQVKCLAWLTAHDLAERAVRERWREQAETDHAKVSQQFLHRVMKDTGNQLWSVAVGVHHGRIFGRRVAQLNVIVSCDEWETRERLALMDELIGIFGPLPSTAPEPNLTGLWYVAGLIAVADWIGSNEAFFPVDRGFSTEESRQAATRALKQIRWSGGKLRRASFEGLFDGYEPKPLQSALQEHCTAPGLFIVEGPMGCGKTEAALWAVHRLNVEGANDGMYFALPTQVTSNRIHQRVAPFLSAALEGSAVLRLAHGASWLDDDQTMVLRPSASNDVDADEHVREGRSWFASSKHALLVRYGVGTVDQALQGVVAVKHFFVRRFGLAGKVVILDELHSYDIYTGTLITHLIRELLALRCTVIILSATLTQARRRELIQAAGGNPENVASSSYPLLTVVREGQAVIEREVAGADSRTLKVRTSAFRESEILNECISRAEAGQHVLYLRNTVAEAQATCRAFISSVRENRVEVGLLHSRFPFFRRQQLEGIWLERLGRQRARDGKGSILIATQVVEQSVDIDLDFIVTDLAPTDMLLQRMGRLWRHERTDRLALEPEFWINAPELLPDASVRELKTALGRTGLVYAPYILLRSAEVFAAKVSISLPDDIRGVLEATYTERDEGDESPTWHELRAILEKDREAQAALADSATRVFGQQSQKDAEGLLTRRSGPPTRDLILLRSCEMITREKWQLTPLDGVPFEVSGIEWSLDAARILHRHLVRAPLYTVPRQAVPPWLALHVHIAAAWALVQADGSCNFPEAEGTSALAYSSLLGLHSQPGQFQPRYTDDDEFDY